MAAFTASYIAVPTMAIWLATSGGPLTSGADAWVVKLTRSAFHMVTQLLAEPMAEHASARASAPSRAGATATVMAPSSTSALALRIASTALGRCLAMINRSPFTPGVLGSQPAL